MNQARAVDIATRIGLDLQEVSAPVISNPVGRVLSGEGVQLPYLVLMLAAMEYCLYSGRITVLAPVLLDTVPVETAAVEQFVACVEAACAKGENASPPTLTKVIPVQFGNDACNPRICLLVLDAQSNVTFINPRVAESAPDSTARMMDGLLKIRDIERYRVVPCNTHACRAGTDALWAIYFLDAILSRGATMALESFNVQADETILQLLLMTGRLKPSIGKFLLHQAGTR